MSDVQITISNEGDAQVISASLQETQITSSVPGIQGPVGQGFPSGGTTNQVLFKQSNTSYDAVWGFVTSSMIGDLEIVNADVASGAAIAGTKISPNFGSQNVITTGTNTAASFIPSSSSVPTNGLYLPAANSVALSTNGTGRLFVDSSGNVGMGTANPVSQLHIQKATGGLAGVQISTSTHGSTLTDGLFVGIDNSIGYLYQYENLPLVFGTNATERLRITSAGLVGIGTSAPGATLHVEGLGNTVNQRIFTSDNVLNATASLTFGTTPGSRSKAAIRMINVNTGNAQGALSLLTDTGTSGLVDRLYIDGNGRVGIGTTGPNYELHVNASDALSIIQLTNTSTGTAASDGFLIYNNGVNATISNEESGYLRFQTAGLERAQIDSSGRLLVGTSTSITAPDAVGANRDGSLQLAGNLLATTMQGNHFFNVSGTGPLYQFTKSNTSTIGSHTIVALNDRLGTFQWSGSDGTNYIPAAQIYAQVDASPGANDMPGRLVFATTADGAASPTERLRIDSSGRLLIGTATNRTGYSLQVEGTSEATGSSSVIRNSNDSVGGALDFGKSRGTTLNSNTIVIAGDRLGSIRFKGADGSALLTGALIEAKVDGTPGANDLPTRLEFSTTADGASSPTERMRIDSSGRVGIGTSTPDSPLQVIGSTSAHFKRTDNGTSSILITANDKQWSLGAHSDDYFRITREGVGERLRIDSSGRLLVGTSSTSQDSTIVAQGSSGSASAIVRLASSSATPADGEVLGRLFFTASNHSASASVLASRDGGTWTAGSSQPTRLVFSTTADGAASPTERLRITSAGRVGIGTTSPGEKLEVQDGSISVGSSANSSQTNTLIAGYGYILSGTKYGNTSIRSTYNNTNNLSSLEFYTSSSATASTERARIDSSGRLLVGTSTARSNFGGSSALRAQIEGDSFANSGLSITRNSNDNGTPSLCLAKSRSTGNTVVVSDDSLGTVFFEGNDGSNFVRAAQITAQVDGTPGANDMPGRLVFSTTADGASSPTERLRITSAGLVGIGTSAPSVRLQVQDSIAGGSDGTVATLHNFSDTGGDTRYVGLNFRIGSDNGTSAIRAYRTNTALNYETNLSFWTNPVGATQTPLRAMTIDSYQRVGIGTTSPGAKLEVNGGEIHNVNGAITQYLSTGGGAAVIGTLSNTDWSVRTNNVERCRVDTSGRFLVGTSSARANFYNSTLSALLQQEGAASSGDPASRFMSLTYGKGNNDSGVFVFAKHRATTVGGQTIVADGDSLGEVNFQGSDGTEFVQAASIRAAVDGTPGANDMPGRLVFSTTADGASSPTERMRIDSVGRVGIGTTSPQGLFDVAGSNGRLVLANGNTSGGMKITAANSAYNANGYLAFEGYSSEYGRFDSSGRLLVGTSSNPGFSTLPGLVLQGTAVSDPAIGLSRNVDASSIVSGNMLGNIAMGSKDGGIGALIKAEGDGTWSSTSDCPGRLVFSTTADGASSPTERMRISENGRVSIGATTKDYQLEVANPSSTADATARFADTATTASVNAASTATVFTAVAGSAYMVFIHRVDSSARSLFGMVTAGSSTSTWTQLAAGPSSAQFTITVSGLNLQITNDDASARTYAYTSIRLS